MPPFALETAAIGAAIALAAAGCGGAPAATAPPPAAPPELVALKDGAGERCLKTAGAKREKKPDEPAKIVAKHVLVKYAGAKRADASITRTREQACLRAQEALQKLKDGAEFGAIVEAYSDEPGAASREGSVGEIERADVDPAFADAAFELDLYQVSDVVESEFGFHVILRTQ